MSDYIGDPWHIRHAEACVDRHEPPEPPPVEECAGCSLEWAGREGAMPDGWMCAECAAEFSYIPEVSP